MQPTRSPLFPWHLLILAIGFIALPAANAQNAPVEAAAPETTPATEEPAAESEPSAVTTADPEIPGDHLLLLLEPLTKDELLVEVKAWQGLLKAKIQEISDREIEGRKAIGTDADTPEARKTHLEGIGTLREEKNVLSAKFASVVDAYEEKGGDPAEFRQYALATMGMQVDLSDGTAVWSAVSNWLGSETGGKLWLKKALQFVAIIAVFWILAAIVGRLVKRAVDRQPAFSDLLKKFLNKMVRRVILFFGLLVAISSLGVNVSALFALVGGGAFIIGFALQDTLGNFAAGIMVLIYRPFDVGDAVEVGGVSGKVDNVSLVSTTIKTFDNKRVLVPNQSVWGQVITNATASTERRVDLVFGIGYEDDIEKAQGILEKLVADHELVLGDPEPVIKLHELADSSVNFICRPWSKTEDYWTVYWDLTRQVKEAFDAEGVSIPYPQLDVHTKSA